MTQDIGSIFYFEWELNFLHFLQSIHNPALDAIMLFFTNLSVYVSFFLLLMIAFIFFKKTRRFGAQVLLAVLFGILIVNVGLKPFIMRCRPCWLDPTIKLLVDRPTSHSFPSGHSNAFFAISTAIFLYNKKWGIPALVVASLVAFSRLYLFVHWPTDVMGGIATGILSAVLSFMILEFLSKKFKKESAQEETSVTYDSLTQN